MQYSFVGAMLHLPAVALIHKAKIQVKVTDQSSRRKLCFRSSIPKTSSMIKKGLYIQLLYQPIKTLATLFFIFKNVLNLYIFSSLLLSVGLSRKERKLYCTLLYCKLRAYCISRVIEERWYSYSISGHYSHLAYST